MVEVTIPANGWHPRPHQMPLWSYLEGGGLRAIEIAHRRWGKDDVALHWAASSSMTRVGGIWHMLPQFAQARKAIWTAVNPHTGKRRIDEAFPDAIRENTNDQEMFIRFKNGSTWQVIGSDNYDRLVGSSVAGVVFSEWALANPASWAYLAPIVAENNGWSLFITTPRGRNHAKTMLDMAQKNKGWFSEVSTVSDTKAIPLEVVEEQRIEYHSIYGIDAGDALIEQEFFCSFTAAILGAYYGKEISNLERLGRITVIEPFEGYPVHTAWDLGIRKDIGGDSMVIWFWQSVPGDGAGQIRVLGCYSSSGKNIGHYAEVIKARADAWGYKLGTDYVPHDARQREMGSVQPGEAKQRLEIMIECGLKPHVVMDHKVADGISAVRQILPRCWFDEVACEKGLEGLRQYQTEWDEERKIFNDRPMHNWASHYADGFRALAMAYREAVVESEPKLPAGLIVGQTVSPGFRLPSFTEVMAAQEERPRGGRI